MTTVLDRLNRFTNYERYPHVLKPTFSLDGFRRLMHALGDPQERFPSVHVAGTVGKGSVCALLESTLRAAGYRTGLYTSPHLWDVRERIRVNGAMIAEEHLSAHIDAILAAVEKDYSAVTYFEALTAAAFLEYVRAGVDIAVVETGLGGRLDATNVVPPFLAVITRLGLDHKAVLGSTMRQIAAEKAGILKHGGAAVTVNQMPAARETLHEAADEAGVELVEIRADDWCRPVKTHDGLGIRILNPDGPDRVVRMPLKGAFQRENAALTLEALKMLVDRGFNITPEAVQSGFESVQWPGRLETRKRKGRVWILDGAHNPIAARALAREMTDYILVFGIMRDKNLPDTLSPLAACAQLIIATGLNNERARPPAEIAGAAHEMGFRAELAPDMASALELAGLLASPDVPILVTGSLYAVAEAGEILG
jgi:dihydrofolate synthase / folylpolyglutamate synthase